MDFIVSFLPYRSPETQVISMECNPVCQFGSPTGEHFDDPMPYDGF